MHHADGGFIIRILQIIIEQPQLVYKEHAFIHNGAAGQAGDIGAVAGLLKDPADYIKPAVKINAAAYLGRLFDKALPDGRHAVPRLLANDLRVYWHLAPCQKLQPLFTGDKFKQLHRLCALMLTLGEEKHTHAVFALAADTDIQLFRNLGEEAVADLEQNTHAVAGLALSVLAGAMLQPLHDAKRVADGLVGLAALDIHHCTNTAGIVLILGIIQAEGFASFSKLFHCLSHPHTKILKRYRGTAHSVPQLLLENKKDVPAGYSLPVRNALVPIHYIILKPEKDSSDSCTKYHAPKSLFVVRKAP